MEGAHAIPGKGTGKPKRGRAEAKKVAERNARYEVETQMKPGEIVKRVAEIEDEMHKAAKALEFEKAAELRDEMVRLKEMLIG